MSCMRHVLHECYILVLNTKCRIKEKNHFNRGHLYDLFDSFDTLYMCHTNVIRRRMLATMMRHAYS